jgi:hypothetical protein
MWRRRKCAEGHLSYTMQQPEYFVEGGKAGRPKEPPKPRPAKPIKPKKKPVEKPKPYGPALKEWNIVVTKNSPLWLKSIAMKLDER